MGKNIKVSIIIPVYNTEQYIRECLDSIVNQTFKDFECICIDDCSTDNSCDILKEYAQKDDRFVVLNLSENRGQGNARNEGLKIAKGKYITFIDSDDYVINNYLDVLYNAIEKYNTDFVATNFYAFNNKTHEIKKKSFNSQIYYDTIISEDKTKNIYLENIGLTSHISTVCANIFKKEFLLFNNLFFDISVKEEDTLFMWEAIIKSSGFVLIKDYIYYYRINQKNSTISSITLEEKIKYYKQFILLNKNNFEKYLPFCYTYISLSCIHYIEINTLKQAKKIFFLFRKLIYNKDYNIDYNYLDIRLKTKLCFFKFCLKYNFNYWFIEYLYNILASIRKFIKKWIHI